MLDPIVPSAQTPGLPIFTSWRTVLDSFYAYTAWVEYPVLVIIYYIQGYFPATVQFFGDWYPAITFQEALNTSANWNPLAKMVVSNPELLQGTLSIFSGQLNTLTFISMLFYMAINFLISSICSLVVKLWWLIFTEFNYAKKQEAQFEIALKKKNEALNEVESKYHNLSKENSKLQEYTITDELTGTYNKRFFLDQIKKMFEFAQQNKKSISLIMLDIDHFKKLNDTHGHLFGDEVLKRVAETTLAQTPDYYFCCRFGGEEFAIILPDATSERAIKLAETMRHAISQLKFPNQSLTVTASFGVGTIDFAEKSAFKHFKKFDDLTKLADDELYKAKLNGRNQVCFASHSNSQAS
ncbi:MAG: GGDEF domain-containing protein [Vampirovibrionales bacterium]|nr:GGDEF domain-containing protein [Vampirovibrionales bacterium]